MRAHDIPCSDPVSFLFHLLLGPCYFPLRVTLKTIHLSRKALNLREFAHSDSVDEENLADKFPVIDSAGLGHGRRQTEQDAWAFKSLAKRPRPGINDAARALGRACAGLRP